MTCTFIRKRLMLNYWKTFVCTRTETVLDIMQDLRSEVPQVRKMYVVIVFVLYNMMLYPFIILTCATFILCMTGRGERQNFDKVHGLAASADV